MSYNYLPLDRKWLNFQQVKNLLNYDQLVSITFDAHERILKCAEYLNNVSPEKTVENVDTTAGGQPDKAKTSVVKVEEEVPADVVKLMLMLKIKSLSHGQSGVQIESVKRLMEMYNNGVLPVIYLHEVFENGENSNALTQLSLPLIGAGEVIYNGQKRGSISVLEELKWQPLSLLNLEWQSLTSGTHNTAAYALYALKKTAQLLEIADVIAALSSDAYSYPLDWVGQKVNSLNNKKGQKITASIIRSYLEGSSIESNRNAGSTDAYSFSSIPEVHGGARDTFEYVLNVFLNEINSPTESPAILPDENIILERKVNSCQSLALALDMLSTAIAGLANLSLQRTNLLEGQTISATTSSITVVAVDEIRQLLSPPSVVNTTAYGNEKFSSIGLNAATKALQVIGNAEKVIAAELIAASKAWELKSSEKISAGLHHFLQQFRQQVLVSNTDISANSVEQTVKFMREYKL